VADKPIVLSKHVQDMVDERDIDPHWIEQSCGRQLLRSPILAIPELFALMGRLPSLVTVCFESFYYDSGTELPVITLFFDRRATTRAGCREDEDG
jgi:hypothetical protein